MGGAKRYPSIASCGDDGFRRLNPSYYVLNFITASQLPLVRKTDGVDNKTGSGDLPVGRLVGGAVESFFRIFRKKSVAT